MKIPEEIEVEGEMVKLPTRWAICGCCDGNGRSSAYLGAITQSDREPGGDWDDPDDFARYMRGSYDRACDECEGSGKVREVDTRHLSDAVKKAWREWIQEELEYEAMVAAERRVGA